MTDNSAYRDALSAAIKHIGIATYSSGKIFVYLTGKGFPEDIASAVVSELIEREYINDRKASRKVIISRTGKKQESRDYILKRLLAAGIASDVAESVASELEPDSKTCYSLYTSLGFEEDSDEIRTEMIDTALRRGYTYELASAVYNVWVDNLGTDTSGN